MKVLLSSRGNYKKAEKFFEKLANRLYLHNTLSRYGQMGVAALSAATPVDSGNTATSWDYKIEKDATGAKLTFINTNVNKGVNIAIILQYGHGTGTGGYVRGRDYINPAIRPIFDKLADDLWKEVERA